MRSERSDVQVTYTSRGLARFEVVVRHEGLHKVQTVRGDNKYVVTQKAEAKMRQWNDMWAKRQERESAIAERARQKEKAEAKLTTAEMRTEEAQLALQQLEQLLAHTLDIDDTVDWESLKDTAPFPTPKPTLQSPPRKPAPPRKEREPSPADSAFIPELGFFDKLISSRRSDKEARARAQFEQAHSTWEANERRKTEEYEQSLRRYEIALAKAKDELQKQIAAWEAEKAAFEVNQKETNSAIDQQRQDYESGNDPQAIVDYCDLVLGNSSYPDAFPQSYEVAYNADTRILIVDYQLPAISDIPTLERVRYIKTRDSFEEKHLADSRLRKLYDSVLYQIAIRTLHELFEADRINAIAAIVFNGFVDSVDPATGQQHNTCVMTLQASKEEFATFNLAMVDPKECFKRLKGLSAARLHSMTPVAPYMKIDRDDSRFVDSYDVSGAIEGFNLAAMDWEDFEHLIRELFEKEFATTGGEVKVTRASRDGGIDAVIFDPDPLRGGKIVVQAKRYTNTVGVSAVRDLYGTLINEGANKGILVTTANYGPDAHEFARGKPITLIGGGELLHLLDRHGHKARIDLKEAKRILSENDK